MYGACRPCSSKTAWAAHAKTRENTWQVERGDTGLAQKLYNNIHATTRMGFTNEKMDNLIKRLYCGCSALVGDSHGLTKAPYVTDVGGACS